MKTNRIIERIKKCLALAQSDNANEAATALRQAQALMEEHGIKLGQIELSDVSAESIRVGEIVTPPLYLQALARMISEAFAVEVIYTGEHVFRNLQIKKIRYVKFIGTGIYPKVAAYSYQVLQRQLRKDRTAYIKKLKRYKRENKIRRADLFAESWVMAVCGKVKKLAIGEKESTLIQQYMEQEHKNLADMKKRQKTYKTEDRSAAYAGYEAGKNAYLNHGVDGGKQKLLLENQ